LIAKIISSHSDGVNLVPSFFTIPSISIFLQIDLGSFMYFIFGWFIMEPLLYLLTVLECSTAPLVSLLHKFYQYSVYYI